MSIIVPRGTPAVIPGDSRAIILDREQPLRIMKVTPDGHGGVYVYAIAAPKQGNKEAPRGLGKELQPGEVSPAIEATPEELAKRGLPAEHPEGPNPKSAPGTPQAPTPAPSQPEAPPTQAPEPSAPEKPTESSPKIPHPEEKAIGKKEAAKAAHLETAKAEPIADAEAEVDELIAKKASHALIASHLEAIAHGPKVESIPDEHAREEISMFLRDIADKFRRGKAVTAMVELREEGKKHGLTKQEKAGSTITFDDTKHDDVGGTLKNGEKAVVIRPGHSQKRKDGSTVQLDRPVVRKSSEQETKKEEPTPEAPAAKKAAPVKAAPVKHAAPAKKAAPVKKAAPAKKAVPEAKKLVPQSEAKEGDHVKDSPKHIQVGDSLVFSDGSEHEVARIDKKNGRYHFYDKEGKELDENGTILGKAANSKVEWKKGKGAPLTESIQVDPGKPLPKKLLSPPTGKFGAAKDPGTSGDGYAPGGQWGHYGAAGVLMRAPGKDGEPRFLLVQRGPGVNHNKGLWQLPGGALDSKENPYQGASRETIEEVGAHPSYVEGLTPIGEHVYDGGHGWKYTTIAADAPHTFEPKVDGTETGDAKWFTADELRQMADEGKLTGNTKKTLLQMVSEFEPHKGKEDEPKVDLSKKLVKDLRQMAADRGIKIPSGAKKADIIKLLEGGGKSPEAPSVAVKEKAATLADLKAEAKSLGLKHPASIKKADLQQLIQDHKDGKIPATPAKPPGPLFKIEKAPAGVKKTLDWQGQSDWKYQPADAKAVILSGGPENAAKLWYPAFKAELAKRAWEEHGRTLGSAGISDVKLQALFKSQGSGKSLSEIWADISPRFLTHNDELESKTVEQLKVIGKQHGMYVTHGLKKDELIHAIRQAIAHARHVDKQEKLHKAQKAAEKLEKLKEEAKERGIPLEMLTGEWGSFKKVGPQGGSNPGGIYEAPDGSRWYIKSQKSSEHAGNEALASSLYREAGIEAPEVFLGAHAPGLGDHQTATRIVDNPQSDLREKIKEGDKKYLDRIFEGFAMDAWMANWDVAGLNFDNIVSSNGEPVRIDAGGALIFRAQGTPKGDAFGPVVTEWDTYQDPTSNRTVAQLYRTITQEQIQESARKLEKLTPSAIKKLVAQHGLDPSIATTLIERRADLLSRAGMPLFEHGAVEGDKAHHAVSVHFGHMIDRLVADFDFSPEKASKARDAFGHYQGSGYGPINRSYLDKNTPANSYLISETDAMEEVFKHSRTTEDIIVYRGERNPSRSFAPGVWSLVGGMEGMEWTFPPFSSTSTEEHVAHGFADAGTEYKDKNPTAQPTIMKVRVPKGTPAVGLAHTGKSADVSVTHYEREVVLGPGTRYRVVTDHGVDSKGVRHLDVEVVLAEQK
jgi:8-oxo-dGTP pyrophosphatase MutT (NUDIX family)